jgi:hypothetical protein
LLLPQNEATVAGTRYNVPLINSLVLYVGIQVSFLQSVFSLERKHIMQKYALKSQMMKAMLLHHLKHPLNYYFHHIIIIGTHDVLL